MLHSLMKTLNTVVGDHSYINGSTISIHITPYAFNNTLKYKIENDKLLTALLLYIIIVDVISFNKYFSIMCITLPKNKKYHKIFWELRHTNYDECLYHLQTCFWINYRHNGGKL